MAVVWPLCQADELLSQITIALALQAEIQSRRRPTDDVACQPVIKIVAYLRDRDICEIAGRPRDNLGDGNLGGFQIDQGSILRGRTREIGS